jgi:formate dehydrogenase iron-sulfur subunit
MASVLAQDLLQSSASTTTPSAVRGAVDQVAKLIDVSKCIGCKACQVACMQWNDLRDEVGTTAGVYDNQADLTDQSWTVMRFSEVERENGGFEWLIRKDGCMHCMDPGCLKACPAPGTIVQHANGIVEYLSDSCTGCGYCITGCPFNIPRLSKKDGKAYKCTLCADRIAVGREPACVKTCPTGAIQFGTKDDMLRYGDKRAHDLKERGFANAGVYNPQGVGGTHVMYVLKHADTPELYHGLPKDPSVSPLVSAWKSWPKSFAAIGLGLAAFGAFFHYVTRGPKADPGEDA